jgi:mannobiose 2-epimerase
MIDADRKQEWRRQLEQELAGDILPFWLSHTLDRERGGFYGLVANDGRVDRDAQRSAVLTGRILWTFAAAYRVYQKPEYLQAARHAYEYLTGCFQDLKYGGFYWMVDAWGASLNTRKQIYAQAFAHYAASEYYRAAGEPAALALAQDIFRLIEEKSHDPQTGGYFEAYHRDWSALQDWRLSEKDLNCPKSMNTLLHVLEACTNLLRIWDDALLKQRLTELIEVFLQHVIDPHAGHFKMFFEADWASLSDHVSYGHDIEGSWLLLEAAQVLGDPALAARVKTAALRMAEAVYNEAREPDGSLLYEASPRQVTIADKHWWAQAEAVVGFYNAYQASGEERYLDAAWQAWQFIDARVIDHKDGEWYAVLKRDGSPYSSAENPDQQKVGPWKCPYHNSRMCFEMMERLNAVAQPV